MRSNPYEQRISSTRQAGNSRWNVVVNASLVTIAFVFVGAVTFGLLG